MIRLEGLRLSLHSRAGTVDILRGVDLRIDHGQSVAILGPSGSGKTSLLMAIAGLERATGGTVEVGGKDLGELDQDGLALLRGEKIGIVFQFFHLVPTMTALENVALPREFQGHNDAFEVARRLLADVGLEQRLHHFPAELSGGEQQRVAMARALSTRPQLILADEPTGNLDGETGRQIIELLFSLVQRSRATLLLVTHDEHLAQRCERIVRMADGHILSDKFESAA
jgi:putative ABC transport system ATP-binding protein